MNTEKTNKVNVMNLVEQEKEQQKPDLDVETRADGSEGSDITEITRSWIKEQFQANSEQFDQTPATSDIFASCFLFAATGIRLPESERDKVAFISGFLISNAASGGERLQGDMTSVSRVAQVGAVEAKRYHDNYLKDQIHEKKYSIDDIEKSNSNEDRAQTIDTKVRDFLMDKRLDSNEIILVKNEILKAIGITLLAEAQKNSPEDFEEAEECLSKGETSKGIKIILNLVDFSIESPTFEQIIESTCNDWLAQNPTVSAQ